MTTPHLVVLGGLPATGKSTVSSEFLRLHPETAYIRIDSIEQALQTSGEMGIQGVQSAGYLVGYAVVRDLLRSLPVVLVECVNPIALTRRAWHEVAASSGAKLIEVELHCSDVSEHRARVESRTTDIPGFTAPDWEQIRTREYEAWLTADLRIDTHHTLPRAAAAQILSATGSPPHRKTNPS